MAPPPLCKLEPASGAAPGMELLHLHPFGTTPAGAGVGAAPGALPNGASIGSHSNVQRPKLLRTKEGKQIIDTINNCICRNWFS